MQTLDSTAKRWDVILTREKFEDCVFYYSCYSVLYNDQQGDYQGGEGVHLCVIACVCVCACACVRVFVCINKQLSKCR